MRLGDVPVLAMLAAAAVAGYVATDRAANHPPAFPAAPVETAHPPPPPVEEPPTLPPAPPPPAAAEPVLEPPPPPATIVPDPEPEPEPPPPPATAASLLDSLRATLAEVRCADLRVDLADGVLSVTGTVSHPGDQDRVLEIVGALPAGTASPPAIAVASPALCEPLTLVEPLRNANAVHGRPLRVAAISGGGVLTGGQDLVLELIDTAGAGAVQVDYFTVDGGVVHLLPNPSEPAATLEPGVARRIGGRSGRTRFWTIGPPFGQELIVVLSSPAPLFPTPRPEVESAAAYLAELTRTLAGPTADSARAAVLFITTQAP